MSERGDIGVSNGVVLVASSPSRFVAATGRFNVNRDKPGTNMFLERVSRTAPVVESNTLFSP